MTNTILLKGNPLPKEYALSGTDITPGMLCEILSTGKIQPHSVASGNASPLFAQEAFSLPSRDIDDDYTAVDENVHALSCRPGDEIYALLADTENVVIGDLLDSDGAGALAKYLPADLPGDASGADVLVRAPVARAIEAVNNSAGGAVARLKVEVL